jgi:hypothetical protein
MFTMILHQLLKYSFLKKKEKKGYEIWCKIRRAQVVTRWRKHTGNRKNKWGGGQGGQLGTLDSMFSLDFFASSPAQHCQSSSCMRPSHSRCWREGHHTNCPRQADSANMSDRTCSSQALQASHLGVSCQTEFLHCTHSQMSPLARHRHRCLRGRQTMMRVPCRRRGRWVWASGRGYSVFLFISWVRSGRGLKTVLTKLICSDDTNLSANAAGWPMPKLAVRYWHHGHNITHDAVCTTFPLSDPSARLPRHSECCLLVAVCARFCAHVQRCRVSTRRCPRGWHCTTFG